MLKWRASARALHRSPRSETSPFLHGSGGGERPIFKPSMIIARCDNRSVRGDRPPLVEALNRPMSGGGRLGRRRRRRLWRATNNPAFCGRRTGSRSGRLSTPHPVRILRSASRQGACRTTTQSPSSTIFRLVFPDSIKACASLSFAALIGERISISVRRIRPASANRATSSSSLPCSAAHRRKVWPTEMFRSGFVAMEKI